MDSLLPRIDGLKTIVATIIHLCYIFNYKKIVIYSNFLLFNQSFYAYHIHNKIKENNENMNTLIKGHFYFSHSKINRSKINSLKDEFLKYIQNITLRDDDLYIHIHCLMWRVIIIIKQLNFDKFFIQYANNQKHLQMRHITSWWHKFTIIKCKFLIIRMAHTKNPTILVSGNKQRWKTQGKW